MDFFNIRKLAYIFFGIGITIFIITYFTTYSIIYFLISTILIFSSAIILKVGDWIIPSLLYKFKIHPIFSNFEITDEAIIVKSGNEYIAIGGIEILLTRSVAELTEREREALIISWHSFLTSIRIPFKIMITVKPVDIEREFKDLMVEYEKLKLEVSKALQRGDRYRQITYEKKLEELEKIIQRFKSEIPYETFLIAMTQGKGFSKSQAIQDMKSKLNELSTSLSVALNCETRILKGVELVKLIDLHILIPEDFKDFLF